MLTWLYTVCMSTATKMVHYDFETPSTSLHVCWCVACVLMLCMYLSCC
jgi:hypothetical protein